MAMNIESSNLVSPDKLAATILPEDLLLEEFRELLNEDPAVEMEACRAAAEMRNTPLDDLDRKPLDMAQRRQVATGRVNRRAPANPFHSPILGKYKTKKETGGLGKVQDPALRHNPLRGRLIITISVNAALFMIFCQSLISNRLQYGHFYVTYSENSNVGPAGQTLYDLGGLNANAVRSGEWIRLFWSMWMHSGWIHILLNIICQVQYFYMLEPDWGSVRTLLLFWFAALSGNLLSGIMDPCKTTVGSSGGLFGLMGGVVPYCIEFWHSIPRPMCILIFSLITLVVTIATGLSKSTDTWAHFGGLLGGLLFGFGTLTSPAAFLSKEKVLKKQLRKNAIMRWFQQTVNPDCKCGIREWIIRLSAWSLLALMWSLCFVYLLNNYEYQPPGSLTYQGITKCCCCYDLVDAPNDYTRANWLCNDCSFRLWSDNSQTWGQYCHAQLNH